MSTSTSSEKESWDCGGTGGILPAEREKATFDVDAMAAAYYGGEDRVRKRKFILMPGNHMDYPDMHEWERSKMMSTSIKDFIAIHKDFVQEGYRPEADEVNWMGGMAKLTGSLMPSFGLFLPTILGQGSPQQVMAWLPRALNFEIIGCYAQTELSHGSNIRGLQTTAEYDRTTEEFVLNTPTLGATKWWNSNIGCVATHAAVYAQLIVEGKEYGLHVFMLQVRDEKHRVLPGIEAGDCGSKMGDEAIDTGYLRLRNVRIPREHMFAKRQYVSKDGQYIRRDAGKTKDPKKAALAKRAAYLTMMQARSGMTALAAGRLSIACTVAIRYSCVRTQGFTDTREGQSFKSTEFQVIDYGVQRYRLFKQLAICLAMQASGAWMGNAIGKMTAAATSSGDMDDATEALLEAMPEIHASSSGLKGVCTKMAADGIEDLRKCCGGHGFLRGSGVGSLGGDFVWQVSAEGDWIVLQLQLARFLVKARRDAIQGKELAGLTKCLAPLRRPDFRLESKVPKTPTSVQEVKSIDYLMALFEVRTIAVIMRVGSRLDEKLKTKPFEQAWNECSVSLRGAAETHIYYFMLRNWIDVIKVQTDPNVVPVLTDLCALFALIQIKEGDNWVGLLTPALYDLVEDAIQQTLEALRPNAVALVDAFQVPDRVLGSLGRYDGNVYEELLAQAKMSSLNQRGDQPFEGFHDSLEPHLDKEFLKLRNKVSEELQGMDADTPSPSSARL